MNRMLQRYLRRGCKVSLYVGGYENVITVEGRVSDCDSEFIAVDRDETTTVIYRLSDIRHFEIHRQRENEVFRKTAIVEPMPVVVAPAFEIPTQPTEPMENSEEPEPMENESGLFRTEAEKDAAKGPKVLGKIDLTSIPDRKRRRIYGQQNKPMEDDDTEMMRPIGYVNRIGMKFGWITPYDNPEKSVYMSLNEIICCDGIVGIPQRGDDVVYTPGRNNVGPTAQCVHKVCTFGQQEELIERLSGYDNRNARLLREQIDAQNELPSTPIAASDEYDERPQDEPQKERPTVKVHIIPSAPIIQQTETPSASSQLPGRELPYEEFLEQIYGLLDEIAADPEKVSMAHQVLSRGISRARAEGDTAVALVLCDKALNIFEQESGSHRYFSSIRENISLFNTQEGQEAAVETDNDPENSDNTTEEPVEE